MQARQARTLGRAGISALLLAGWCLGMGAGLAAQAVPQPPLPPDESATSAVSPLPLPRADIPDKMDPDLAPPAVPDNYQIGRTDLLDIFVYQMPELTSQIRVNSEGYIELPFLRRPLAAAGETPLQLRAAVTHELVAEGLAREPLVRVVVRQVESRPIVVTGAVKYPMVIQAARPMSLMEVLTRAGGLQNSAGTTVLVSEGTGAQEVTREYSVEQLLQSSGPSEDPLLVGSETVRVIPARLVYAVGALQKPGAFPIEAGEPITVLKALALSGGFSAASPADKKHAEIIRTDAQHGRQEIAVNLDRILKHKNPDVTLAAGDILYVPENGARKVLATALADAGSAATIALGYRVKF